MNSFFALALLLTPTVSSDEGWTPELALEVKRVGDVRPSPDGSLAAFIVGEAVMKDEKSEWVSQIYVARSDGSGSFQLTRGESSSTSPRWSPDGRWIAFLSSRGGEHSNLWRIAVGGGEAERLTDEKGGIEGFVWSPDGSHIAFTMPRPPTDEEEKAEKEKRDAKVVDDDLKMVDLYVLPLATNEEGKRLARKLTTGRFSVGGPFGEAEMDWSPDGRSIVFSHQPTPRVNDWPLTDISVVDVASGEIRVLVETDAAESQPVYSPDGRWIAFTASDIPPSWGFTSRVQLIPASGGQPEPLAESYDQQPSIVGWSGDGARVYITEIHRTVSRLSALPRDGGQPVDVTPPDRMVDGANLNDTGTHFGFSSESMDTPPEAFVSNVARFEAVRVSEVQRLPELPLGRTDIIEWSSTDGTRVEGLLTYPVDYREGARVPLLVIVHGGPAGVFTQSFIASRGAYPIASFASRGYAILQANVRGSSGYGRGFRYANYEDWGGGDYQDIMSGVDHVIELGVADPNRLGVMGWSYGGFMTSWILTQTDRFKAASVGAGVTNLMSFTGTADIPGFLPDYFGGEYWDVFDRFRSHSAMFNVKGVTTPTLIQHGENDRRVPISQGYELYNALKRQGVETKMVVYPRQPHGIREPRLQLDAMKRNLDWFERFLPTGRSTTSN
ncbi:MAG TPA: S9 family peptidase [Vicinamibacteria bacterium]|nr:S9 family peptidase [Vicinamibacteria bacterium]